MREEDKKNAVRSVREITDPAKQKRQQKVGIVNGTHKEGGDEKQITLQSQTSQPSVDQQPLDSNNDIHKVC